MSILSNKVDISEAGRRYALQRIDSEFKFEDFEDPIRDRNSTAGPGDSKLIEDSIEWTVNINDVVPEIFRMFIQYFLLFNHVQHLIKFRLVSKHWKSNIDEYLESRQV